MMSATNRRWEATSTTREGFDLVGEKAVCGRRMSGTNQGRKKAKKFPGRDNGLCTRSGREESPESPGS